MESSLTLARSLTQVVGPAVPGLVLVGEPGVKGGSAIVLKLVLNVFSHVFCSAVTAPGTDHQYRWKKEVDFTQLKKAHRVGGLLRGFVRLPRGD